MSASCRWKYCRNKQFGLFGAGISWKIMVKKVLYDRIELWFWIMNYEHNTSSWSIDFLSTILMADCELLKHDLRFGTDIPKKTESVFHHRLSKNGLWTVTFEQVSISKIGILAKALSIFLRGPKTGCDRPIFSSHAAGFRWDPEDSSCFTCWKLRSGWLIYWLIHDNTC